MRFALPFLIALIAAPAMADTTAGAVLAFDRKAGIIVLTDKTVWTLPAGLAVPEDLVAGDRVQIDFTMKGDEGVTAINAITRTMN